MQINHSLLPYSLSLLSWPLNWIIFLLWGSLAMICHPSLTQRALQLLPHLGWSRIEFIHREAWEQSWQSALAFAPAHANLLTSHDTVAKKKTKSLQKILFSHQLCLPKQRFSVYNLIYFPTRFETVPNMAPNKASLPAWRPGPQWDQHPVKSSLLV